MDSVVLVVQMVLAAVFVTAGISKLFDLRGSRQALVGFGVPSGLAAGLGVLLPFVEIAVAAALVSASSAPWGAAAAVILLLVFAAAIANAMAQGRAPDCHCFGNLHSAPAGGKTLARNLGLAALAALVVLQGPEPDAGDWVADRSAVELLAIGAGAVMLVLAELARRLWAENRSLRRALARAESAHPPEEPEGLPVGTVAPGFELATVDGGTRTLESLRAGRRPAVLVFFDPGCGPCRPLVPHVARWQAALGERLGIGVISSGNAEFTRAAWQGPPAEILLAGDSGVTDAYRVRSWPSAVGIAADGRIATAPALSQDTMEVLIRAMLEGKTAVAERNLSAPLSITVVGR